MERSIYFNGNDLGTSKDDEGLLDIGYPVFHASDVYIITDIDEKMKRIIVSEIDNEEKISTVLSKYVDLDEYRQHHLSEIEWLCKKVLDNDLGSYANKQWILHAMLVLKKSSSELIGPDDISKHVNGIIAHLKGSFWEKK